MKVERTISWCCAWTLHIGRNSRPCWTRCSRCPRHGANNGLAQLAQCDAPLARDLRDLLTAADEASHASFLGGVADAQAGSAPMQVGGRLGPLELLEVVGEGGMGLVWKAQCADVRLAGHAAIKLFKHGHFDRGTQERFRREGVLLARLQHEGIARLLDAGVTPQGKPYLVLEWVDGLTRDCVFPMTPSHAAPEQFAEGTLGITDDVYALGLALFELLTGRHPPGLEPPVTPMAWSRAASENSMHRAIDLARLPADLRKAAESITRGVGAVE